MIIVLFGVAGSGKSTIGKVLETEHHFAQEAFANPIKAMAKLAFPAFTDDDLYGPSENREREYGEYPLTSCPWCGGPIKHTLEMGGSLQCLNTPEHNNLPPFISPRLACRTLGTEWGRRLYKNVWIDGAFERIRQIRNTWRAWAEDRGLPNRAADFVITDGRFLNECQRSRQLGAVTVKLTRGLGASTATHASEAEFRDIPNSEFDYVFNNQLITLEETPREVGHFLKRITDHALRR
jgi:hypothetical protein